MSALPASLTALRPDGTAEPLADLWRDGPAVLFFIRHFG